MHLRLMLALTAIGSGTANAQTTRISNSPAAQPKAVAPRPTPPLLSPPAGTSVALTPAPEIAETIANNALGVAALFNPSVSYRIQYGDAIPNGLGAQLKTTIHRLSPGFSATFAERWTLSYTPSFVWYTNKAFDDRVNHSVIAQGTGAIGEVDIGLSQSYNRSSDVLFETARMTKQEVWATGGSASYGVGERTKIEVSGSQYLRYAEDFADSKTWQGQAGLRYRYSETLTLAASAGSGYSAIDPGPDYTTQSLSANANWNPSARLSLGLSGGGEFVRFKSGNAQTRSRPTFAASLRYQIFEPTSISINAGQSTGAAYFTGQYTETLRVGIGVTQRLFGRFSLAVSASESTIDYVSASNILAAPSRADRLRSYQASLRTQLRSNLSAAVSWQDGQNRSSSPGYVVDGTILGAEISWRL